MRGPAGVPVAVIRRVMLSNITCINAAAADRLDRSWRGFPGHPIEDVKISDVMMVHSGRRNKGRCATAGGGEREGLSGAERCLERPRRMDFSSGM